MNVYRIHLIKLLYMYFLIFPLTDILCFFYRGNRYSKKIMERKITKTIVQSSSIYLKQDEKY